MSINDFLNSVARKPVWLVKMWLDRCQRTYGDYFENIWTNIPAPTGNYTLGKYAYYRLAHKIKLEAGEWIIRSVKVKLTKYGAVSDGVRCKIVRGTDNPDLNDVIATSPDLAFSEGFFTFNFNTSVNEDCWLVWERTGEPDDYNMWLIGSGVLDYYSYSQLKYQNYNTGDWTEDNFDIGFTLKVSFVNGKKEIISLPEYRGFSGQIFGTSSRPKQAQSFSINEPVRIKSIRVWLFYYNNPADSVRCKICGMSDGVPDENDFRGYSLNAYTKDETGMNHSCRFNFNFNNIYLPAGTYCFILERTGEIDNNNYWFASSRDDWYSGGNRFYLESSWYSVSSEDLEFAIYGIFENEICYYTYTTCKYPEYYLKGTHCYKFTSRSALVNGSFPLLIKPEYVPMEINPKSTTTTRANFTAEISDDAPLVYANPDKAVSAKETAGTFLRNLLARNPNYYHRLLEVYLGFEGLPESDYRLFFRGLLEKIEQKDFSVKITAKDLLKSLDAQSHLKASDNCKLADAYSGGSPAYVYYGNELPEWGIIKSEDGKFIKFSGKSGPDENGVWTLQNATYCFNSGGTIPSGKKVKQVLVYARDENGIGEGLSIDLILLDLILNRARLGKDYIKMVDSGGTLTSPIDNDDTTIPVSSIYPFPDQGVIKIDDELIVYKGVSGNNLLLDSDLPAIPLFYKHHRGAFGTTATGHQSGAKIYIPKITAEANDWLLGLRFRREIDEPVKVIELVNQICEQARVYLWQNEDSLIDFMALAPPRPQLAIMELDDKSHIIEKSVSVVEDPDFQASRVIVYYNPNSTDPGTDPEKYDNAILEIEEDIENENYLNCEKPKIFYASWIYRNTEALALASRHLANYRYGVRRVKFQLELKDLNIELGDRVWLSTDKIVKADGSPDRLLMTVLEKQFRANNRIEFNAIEAKTTRKYAYIGYCNPTLYSGISESDSSIIIQLIEDPSHPETKTWQNSDFEDTGIIRIDDEFIRWISKSYSSETKLLTLNCTGGRGFLGSSATAHNAGVDVLLLYCGAGEITQRDYGWIGNNSNYLDSDADGTADEEGYYIY